MQGPVHCIQTDASAHWGYGASSDFQWLQQAWSPEWSEVSIMAKELVPNNFSCTVWAPLLTRACLEFQCDNLTLVEVINKGFSKDLKVMHLFRCLWFFRNLYDISIHVSHIPGVQNNTVDHARYVV